LPSLPDTRIEPTPLLLLCLKKLGRSGNAIAKPIDAEHQNTKPRKILFPQNATFLPTIQKNQSPNTPKRPPKTWTDWAPKKSRRAPALPHYETSVKKS